MPLTKILESESEVRKDGMVRHLHTLIKNLNNNDINANIIIVVLP